MATGSYPASIGPAGSDPVMPLSRRSDVRAPAAERYDGQRREFALLTDGTIEGSTTVEQGVRLAMCVRRGQLAHAKTIGNDLRKIRPSTPQREASEVRTAIEQATPLDALLAERKVEILGVAHEFSRTGRLTVALEWRDLTTGNDATTTND